MVDRKTLASYDLHSPHFHFTLHPPTGQWCLHIFLHPPQEVVQLLSVSLGVIYNTLPSGQRRSGSCHVSNERANGPAVCLAQVECLAAKPISAGLGRRPIHPKKGQRPDSLRTWTCWFQMAGPLALQTCFWTSTRASARRLRCRATTRAKQAAGPSARGSLSNKPCPKIRYGVTVWEGEMCCSRFV